MQTIGIASLALAMVALPALTRRPDRLALGALAASITLGALLGLDEAADSMLSAHMLQHVLIGDVVPLLLVLSVRELVGFAPRPAVALAFWACALAVWHVPAAYDLALEIEPLHAFEHATFLLAGVLVWAVLLDPARRALAGWRRFGYALALLAASGALANVLILSYRPLYPSYAHTTTNPLRDQSLAALLMMLEQLATVGTFAVLCAREQLRRPAAERAERHPLAA